MYPKHIRAILNKIDLESAKKYLGIAILPSQLIVDNIFISAPVIRPDKRLSNSN